MSFQFNMKMLLTQIPKNWHKKEKANTFQIWNKIIFNAYGN